MLSMIITKKVNQRIVQILLKRRASLSEIARESNTTKANVFYALRELEKEDIIRKEIQGRTHVYRFNFLRRGAKDMMTFFLEETKNEYIQKMNGLPTLLNSMLENIFKNKYHGCIFFGSSLKERYNDIDVFVLLDGAKPSTLQREVRGLCEKISLVLGTKHELEEGIKHEDMLYRNIVKGIPFGCENLILELRHRQVFLRRKDMVERLTLGYREILSCLEFTEKEYVEKHLEKGTADIMYAVLHYFELFAENDTQAKKMFKKQLGFTFSDNVEKAKKQAEKIGRMIL